MLKMDTLRAALVGAVPELQSQPARLRMWVDKGSAQTRQTTTLGFAYKFRLNTLVMDLATDISVLGLAIFIWLRVNQPELLAPDADGFSFEVDVLDNSTVDVLIQLDLTQNVSVALQEDGKYALVDLPEPANLFDDGLGLVDPAPAPLLSRITLTDGTILLPEDSAP